MAASNILRTDGAAETLTLGGVRFTAEKFALSVQRASVTRTLSDGAQHVTVLGEAPCTLRLSGRIIPDDGAQLAAKLRTLLSGEAEYSFTCRGCQFQNMRLTGLECSADAGKYDAMLSLTLAGTMKGADA